MIYDILTYGAIGDGESDDSAAIQDAIDACAAAGGGRVLVPGGRTYRCGSLVLRSNVELHLEMGAVLKGSDNLNDYDLFRQGKGIMKSTADVPTYENCDYAGVPTLYFIYAKDCENVAITGFGKIDGNEEIFYGTITPWHIDGAFYPRVPLLFIENVSHLTLTQVTLTKSAFWTVHLVGCKDVLIDGIRIQNSLNMANCDGIDPDHCQNVRITNCQIESADDCIVFKNSAATMKYGPCENICVSGCTLTSTSAAIKFGSESEAPFRNIVITNCNISRTNRAISFQLRDKGCVENVLISGINMETRIFSKQFWGTGEAVTITAVKRKEDTDVGYIRNIILRDINCNCENGILIYGDKSCNISDITLENVNLKLRRVTKWPNNCIDLRPAVGDGLIEGPQAAVYARNARNITFRNFTLEIPDELTDAKEKPYNISECDNFVINGTCI